MKKLLALLFISSLLAGCGSMRFNEARSKANLVQNGMTFDEVVKILGISPYIKNSTYAVWTRAPGQQYDGTAQGPIRFEFRDGRVVDVPVGGIFSEAAVSAVRAARAEKLRKEEEERLAQRAADAELARAEILAETSAAARSSVSCGDKETCSKAFALAQIYVAKNSDQKIQVATDTIIETYNPTEAGRIGIAVIKTPQKGATEVLSITPSCKESETRSDASLCRQQRTRIYAGFRPFIEAQLAK